MNIFLPYEDVNQSIRALDDRRLVKQILECKQLLDVALGNTNGWSRHPVAVYYKDYPHFIARFGLMCCLEYELRFNRTHRYSDLLMRYTLKLPKNKRVEPYYASGSKGSDNCIRTVDNATLLFKQKLINKWENDKQQGRPPKWTKRLLPEFYLNKEKYYASV